jgi:hypothetical protein
LLLGVGNQKHSKSDYPLGQAADFDAYDRHADRVLIKKDLSIIVTGSIFEVQNKK